MRVSPFGHLRIKAYVRLPGAFRSLSRPSSAPSAKASALRSSSLDQSVSFDLFVLRFLAFYARTLYGLSRMSAGLSRLSFVALRTSRLYVFAALWKALLRRPNPRNLWFTVLRSYINQ